MYFRSWIILMIISCIASSQSLSKNDRFFLWLEHHGVSFRNMYIGNQSQPRGLYTNVSISQSQKVISIPKHLLITEDMGENTYVAQQLRNANVKLKNPALNHIVLFLIHQIRHNGTANGINFEPYMNLLPESYNDFPIFWDGKQLGILGNSNFLMDINALKKKLQANYDKMNSSIPEFDKICSLRRYMELYSFVSSRNFEFRVGEESILALVPLADMINHDVNPKLAWSFNSMTNQFQMTSTQNIDEQRELTDSYGDSRNNARFLLSYGFVPTQNDTYVMFRDLFPTSNYTILETSLRRSVHFAKMFKQLSDSYSLIDALFYVVRVLFDRLCEYPTQMTQDIDNVLSLDQHSNAYSANMIVLEEKRILFYHLSLFQHILLTKYVDTYYRMDETIDYIQDLNYFDNVIAPAFKL